MYDEREQYSILMDYFRSLSFDELVREVNIILTEAHMWEESIEQKRVRRLICRELERRLR